MMTRKRWTRLFAVGLMGVATLALAVTLAAQEASAPPHPPQEENTSGGKPGHGGSAEKRLEKLSHQLNLTDEQRAKIRPLLQHEVERIKEVRSNSSLSQGEAQRRIRLIHRDTNQRIGEFLTPEQKQQWKEDRQQHRGGPPAGEHGPGGAPDSPPAPPNQN